MSAEQAIGTRFRTTQAAVRERKAGMCQGEFDKQRQNLYSYGYRAAGEIAVPCTCNPLQQG